MTEEIIIDGVNVAGCEYISDIDCSCIFVKNYYGTTTNPRCSQVKNCHYKQLKHLEQENKELKEKIIKLSEEKGHLIVENNTLKEKNEGLKIKHQRYRECSMQLNKKYKSALEEIRNYCDRIEQGSVIGTQDCVINSIKNITNEVLE